MLKKVFLKIFTGKQLCWSLFLINLQAGEPALQVFSTEICKIFKETHFQEHLYHHVTLFTVHEKDTANEA